MRVALVLFAAHIAGCWPTFDLYLGLPDVEADAVVVTSKTVEGHRAFGADLDGPRWDWDVSEDSDLEAHYFACSLDALGVSAGELQPADGPPTTAYPETVGSFARPSGEDDWGTIPSPTLDLGIDYEPCPTFEIGIGQGLGFRRTILWATRTDAEHILVGSEDGVVRVSNDGTVQSIDTDLFILAAKRTPGGLLAVTAPDAGSDEYKTYRGSTIEDLAVLENEIVLGPFFNMEMAVRTTPAGYEVFAARGDHIFSVFDGGAWSDLRLVPLPPPTPFLSEDVFVVSSGNAVFTTGTSVAYVVDLTESRAVPLGGTATGLVHHPDWGLLVSTVTGQLVGLDESTSTAVRGAVVVAESGRLLMADRGLLSLLHRDGLRCEIGPVNGKVFRAFPTDSGFLVVSRSSQTNEAIVTLVTEVEPLKDCSAGGE